MYRRGRLLFVDGRSVRSRFSLPHFIVEPATESVAILLGVRDAFDAGTKSKAFVEMALKFPPKPGLIVICDYTTGFRAPEMVKERLAVVISPRLPYRDRLCTVVPLSTTPAKAGIRYQCRIELPQEAPSPYEGRIKWAKADMLATVCFDRLGLPYTGRDRLTGKRKYFQILVSENELMRVQRAVLHSLGLDSLTEHLTERI